MAVPQLHFNECQLDSITLSWNASAGVGYRLEYREITVPDWVDCHSKTIPPGESSEITVTGLNPSSSYIFRLYTIAPGGAESGPGPEVAFDTEVVSCAPKQTWCCTIS
ncbi:unnamed protein product [Ascophyllum nodosum]